jgi:hypothetical protein
VKDTHILDVLHEIEALERLVARRARLLRGLKVGIIAFVVVVVRWALAVSGAWPWPGGR